MRAAYLDEARPDQVSHAVRDVLHRQGALVSDHSLSRVAFRGYKPSGKWTWDRGGYVGIYQHTGEKEVEVRLLLRARWPFRLLWLVALVNVVAAVATFIINPSGTTWFAVAAVCGFALLVAGILYVNTWKPVWREERDLMAHFEEAFAQGFGDELETAEEREARLFEERVEGEIERLRLRDARKAEPAAPRRGLSPPRPRFTLARGAASAPSTVLEEAPEPARETAEAESPDARRARLLARKAELEAARSDDAPASQPEKRSRFSLPQLSFRRKQPTEEAHEPEESLEERKARLLARKAEIERERED